VSGGLGAAAPRDVNPHSPAPKYPAEPPEAYAS
jgi:hypothetical protein